MEGVMLEGGWRGELILMNYPNFGGAQVGIRTDGQTVPRSFYHDLLLLKDSESFMKQAPGVQDGSRTVVEHFAAPWHFS